MKRIPGEGSLWNFTHETFHPWMCELRLLNFNCICPLLTCFIAMHARMNASEFLYFWAIRKNLIFHIHADHSSKSGFSSAADCEHQCYFGERHQNSTESFFYTLKFNVFEQLMFLWNFILNSTLVVSGCCMSTANGCHINCPGCYLLSQSSRHCEWDWASRFLRTFI